MKISRLAPLLVLAVVGSVALPGFSHSAELDAATGPGSNDEYQPQGATSDGHQPILDVLRGIEVAFSAGDLPGYLSFFHRTYVIMAPEGVVAPSTEAEAIALLQPQMEHLRARGYARSELNQPTIKLLSATTALAAAEWIRRTANDEELERIGATYALFKTDDGWKVVMVTVHPPASVVDLQ